jgi:hypothetical protein
MTNNKSTTDQFAIFQSQLVLIVEFEGNEVLIQYKDGHEKYVAWNDLDLVD